jgi:hypothetical protein
VISAVISLHLPITHPMMPTHTQHAWCTWPFRRHPLVPLHKKEKEKEKIPLVIKSKNNNNRRQVGGQFAPPTVGGHGAGRPTRCSRSPGPTRAREWRVTACGHCDPMWTRTRRSDGNSSAATGGSRCEATPTNSAKLTEPPA